MVKKESKDICCIGIDSVYFGSFIAIFFGIGSYMMFAITGNDTYIAATIGGIITIGLFYIFNYIFSNNHKENIYKLNNALFGKVFGNFLNFILFLTFFILAGVILYNLSNFLHIEYFPDANINFLKSIILVSLIYISSKSLPEIIRVNQIFAYVSFAIFVISIIGLFPSFDIKNIEPIYSTGHIDMLKSILIYVILSIVPYTMILTTCKKRINYEYKASSSLFKTVIFSNIVQISIILVATLLLGEEFIKAFRFPEYIVLKQFSLFNILERIENILALEFYFNTISLLALLYHYMIKFLPNLSIKKSYSYIISIILFFVTTIIFKNATSFTTYINKYLIYVILVGLLLPILFTFFKMIFDKKHKITM